VLRQGSFSKFDYGAERNYEVYGTPAPPPYDLSKIPDELPVFLVYGGRDPLSDPADVRNLISLLPCRLHTLFLPSYAHLDFVLSTSGNADIYSKIVAFFKATHSKTLNPKP
jgi:lysosomal acid lipase/cholesteryl ester hydrolase